MRINTKSYIVALGLLTAGFALGQNVEHMPVTLGLKAGIPVTDMFSSSNTGNLFTGSTGPTLPGSNYSSHTPRYIMGVSAEFHMPLHLRFEVDALYKRGGFNSSVPFGTGTAYSPTSFNWWEFPGLFKYNISMGHFRPFIDFGATLRHISTITQTSYLPGNFQGVITNNSNSIHNRNSFGGVAGIGITFKKGPFELTPEARYTRWANQAFASNNGGLRTNLDQGDVLLGISF
ncbi:MAG: outer membrane beta-barrel protein [Bryobacteraceae bacterium]